jgi:hypothetical protein
LKLAETVHTYFAKKKLLSDKMHRSAQVCEAKKRVQEDRLREFYYQQFLELKKQQELDLNGLIDKWKLSRDQRCVSIETDYDQTLNAAKLLARDLQFDEAIRVRNEADQKLRLRAKKTVDDCDISFQAQCDTLLKTQQRDIALLEKRRDAELTRLNAHLDVSKRELGKRFRRANANEVVAIATDLLPATTVPKALQLQTVRAKPAAPPDPEWTMQDPAGSVTGSTAATASSEIERQMAMRRNPVRRLWTRGAVKSIIDGPLLIGTPTAVTLLPGDEEEEE